MRGVHPPDRGAEEWPRRTADGHRRELDLLARARHRRFDVERVETDRPEEVERELRDAKAIVGVLLLHARRDERSERAAVLELRVPRAHRRGRRHEASVLPAPVEGLQNLLRRSAFLGALQHLAVGHSLLQRSHVVDHQDALQVIVFVLNGDREQALGLELEGLAIASEGADAHLGGALDLLVDPGEAECSPRST